ncbi:MAG: hypothetical protein ACUVWB_04785, partial [Anaerolineae bacterium]
MKTSELPQTARTTVWQRLTGSITTSFLVAFVLTLFLALAGTLLIRYRIALQDAEQQEMRMASLWAQSFDAHLSQRSDLALAL